jgi:syntaxin 16
MSRNVQMSLAQKVQEVSGVFQQKQKSYMQRKWTPLASLFPSFSGSLPIMASQSVVVTCLCGFGAHVWVLGIRGVELRNKDIFTGVQPLNSSMSETEEVVS